MMIRIKVLQDGSMNSTQRKDQIDALKEQGWKLEKSTELPIGRMLDFTLEEFTLEDDVDAI